MDWLIILIILLAVVVAGVWAYRAFTPEIQRARRIRRANRDGLER